MELTQAQYERIAPYLPLQRGNVRVSNRQVLNAILYVAEQGCKWRGLPARFGNWHTIYTRMNRWSKNGVLDGVFEQLQREQIVRIRLGQMLCARVATVGALVRAASFWLLVTSIAAPVSVGACTSSVRRAKNSHSWVMGEMGYFDNEQDRVEPGPNPFTPDKVLTMCPE